MFKRTFVLLLASALLHLQFGCTRVVSTTSVGYQTPRGREYRIVSLVTLEGRGVYFDEAGGMRTVEHATGRDVIIGKDLAGQGIVVPIDSVLEASVETEEPDVAATTAIITLSAISATFLAIVIAFIINPPRSCPYIYSFDGERFVLDAQSYAGAVSQGVERADYSRLEHLRPVDGRYRLMMRNDPVEEKQYTDRIRLYVVDHPIGTVVSPGYDGTFHAFEQISSPTSVNDRNGSNVLPFFSANDGIAWQSQLPRTEEELDGTELRQHLTFRFPRPDAARSARMFVNAGTAFWGSEMVGRFLELHGGQVDEWYAGIDRRDRAALGLFRKIVDDEELYHLKVRVRVGDEWQVRGVIRTGGGLAPEDHALALDLSGVIGDSIEVRIDPPIGFWRIDYVGLDYDDAPQVHVTELLPETIVGADSVDAVELLTNDDARYHALDLPGESIEVFFGEPPPRAGMLRSTFFMAEGWYRVETNGGMPRQSRVLEEIMTQPDAAHRHALAEYVRWVAAQRAGGTNE
jgi:hypothetical protein